MVEAMALPAKSHKQIEHEVLEDVLIWKILSFL
jgi:hypothetical protein